MMMTMMMVTISRKFYSIQVIQPQQAIVIKKPVISQPAAQGGVSVAKHFVLQTSRTPTTGRAVCLCGYWVDLLVTVLTLTVFQPKMPLSEMVLSLYIFLFQISFTFMTRQ